MELVSACTLGAALRRLCLTEKLERDLVDGSHSPSTQRTGVKTYLLTTGTIFGLFSIGHIVELIAQCR